ncbi:hypothetical protein SELMODRAFT_408544 [Selaginella moellendorffii]|uniref:Uncharacterized protein n=1 Tax=Selaginella moellendorffii TaxID=88036 RepID=D8R8M6_SELML|nr:hypothetical protein SELMODRAFT_408544 [Selaginella moellendorffii]
MPWIAVVVLHSSSCGLNGSVSLSLGGTTVAVCGMVGSGKSSLLSCWHGPEVLHIVRQGAFQALRHPEGFTLRNLLQELRQYEAFARKSVSSTGSIRLLEPISTRLQSWSGLL